MYSGSDILRGLWPLKLGPNHEAMQGVSGEMLDAVDAVLDIISDETFPNSATYSIDRWERRYGLDSDPSLPIQQRRDMVIAKIREKVSFSRSFFMAVASALGYEIEIETYYPFVCGYSEAGDYVCDPDIIYVWTIRGLSETGYAFRAGEGQAGEALGYNCLPLDAVFNRLKRAHTEIVFEYVYKT